MKKFFSFIIFILILGAVGSVVAELYAAKNVEIEIEDFKVDNISLTSVQLNLNVKATNPTPFDTYIKSQNLEIFADDKLIGVINRDDPVALAKNSSIYLDYPVSAGSMSVIKLLWSRFVAQKPISFLIKGKLVIRSRFTGITNEVEINRTEIYNGE